MTTIPNAVKRVAWELCLARGETPWELDKGGVERWEYWKPAARAAIRALSQIKGGTRE